MYENMLKRQEYLVEQIPAIEKELRKLPAGRLVCENYGGNIKYYQRFTPKEYDRLSKSEKEKLINKTKGSVVTSKDGVRIYIKKDNKEKAIDLAYKKYLQYQLKEYSKESDAIKAYLKKTGKSSEVERMLKKTPNIEWLLDERAMPMSRKMQKWMNTDYPRRDNANKGLIITGHNNRKYRNASEAFIGDELLKSGIPFRYEPRVDFDDIAVYPVFLIKHPDSGEEIIWEHFSGTDNKDLARKTSHKIQFYISKGYFPGINLIITSENKSTPVNKNLINDIIRQYFS